MKETTENWREEFDKLAPKIDWRGYPARETVEVFIQSLIDKAKEEERDIVRGELGRFEDSENVDSVEFPSGEVHTADYKEGYRKAILSLVSKYK